jgi:general secretion pathway protein G
MSRELGPDDASHRPVFHSFGTRPERRGAASAVAAKAAARARAGFTLIELVVVIAVLAVLAAVVAPEVLRNMSDANSGAARTQIELLGTALDSYRLDNHAYPTTEQGLAALRTEPTAGEKPPRWRGPYLRKAVPADPWDRPYVYVSPGRQNPRGYDLYSLGRDGREGGENEDADITSWGPAER